MNSSTPHVLVIPYPAQGHVIPLLEFSQCLAKQGFKVTFVNTDYNHKRVLESLEGKNYTEEQIHMVSIPDGLQPWENRNGNAKLVENMLEFMPGKLEELIEEINTREAEQIACVIAAGGLGWAIKVAEKMKIKRRAVVWTSSAASLALSSSIPKLIDDGIINENGIPIKKQMIQLAPTMPEISSEVYFWGAISDSPAHKLIFDLMVNNVNAAKAADYLFCNSTYDLEPAAFSMVPKLLPVGPLLASNRLGESAGYLWPEDSNCLNWLEQQQPNSVIYVAFGSHTVLDHIQLQELALGLELCNRPFLWVVRPDLTNDKKEAYPEGFPDRVATRGRTVSWAPQQKVLSHPSIACFLSHCGWNSTVEGVSNGIPFLCWPYFFDQFLNESYICDIWKVGLKFNRNESGIITREEIKKKIDQVLSDENFKARALQLKEKALSSVREGGSSNKTFQNFREWMNAYN
ncbi:UDP-glycosyltransferase [Melia azedarach]|uniref:UDP-glycosyltransferase n=1 Tax=Melia azedarach TaxID=155640 RepID=A0ACC1X7B3_MELAZ|nr:UDP-glycosyltransferase [Melia azedarach]